MGDHHYTSLTDEYDTISPIIYIKTTEYSPKIITIEEKEGDDVLIELYKERRFLYDNSHQDFKNKQKKENAWIEISHIMQQRKLGKYYTPEYCQTRCTSLRDQYTREKRNMKDAYQNGNVSKRKTFVLRSQLSFLDRFIKRRRTFSYFQRTKSIFPSIKDTAVTHEKNSNNESDESEYIQNIVKIPRKRHSTCQDAPQENMENNEQDNNNHNKEINTSKFKRHKSDESKSIEDVDDTTVSNADMNSLENMKENSTNNTRTIDQSFANYIRVHLENIPEPEKSTRKKMIIDALTAPLPKTCTFLKRCTCEMLMKQLSRHLAAIHQ